MKRAEVLKASMGAIAVASIAYIAMAAMPDRSSDEHVLRKAMTSHAKQINYEFIIGKPYYIENHYCNDISYMNYFSRVYDTFCMHKGEAKLIESVKTD